MPTNDLSSKPPKTYLFHEYSMIDDLLFQLLDEFIMINRS